MTKKSARPGGPSRGSGGPSGFAGPRPGAAADAGQAGLEVVVRVRPGASRTAVGGRYGEDDVLTVAVSAPAVDGRATDAVLEAVAAAFGVRPRDVTLVRGATSRTKSLRVDGDIAHLRSRLADLLGGSVR